MKYQKWESKEPNMDRGQEACAFLKSSGLWGDADCQDVKYFLCYNENDMWQWKYIRTGMTWRDAQQYCRTHYTDLVTIADDNVNIILVLKIIWDGEAWIGLSRSFWQWSDQTQVSWPSMKWIAGQPDNDNGNEECAYVHYDGLIADDSCSVQHPFFCTQIRKKQFVRVAMKSGGHWNESAVMEAIEKKINQTLVDSGSSVTWRVQSDEKIFHEKENIEREMTTTNQICEK
ncbi:L-selectin [Myxocyprinus asiaticus]|uniref:L-selectin n=1 Tax=Myxocyprinus asiaticus TaxID=70543 RepID=UPI002221729E|nr:L-selectin [Myxocyprinus asiaticus]